MGAPDWSSDLTRSLNRMTQDINEQVQHFTRNLHAQIEENVQRSLQPALEQVQETINNLPRDAHGRIITNGNIISNGNIMSITSQNGISKIVMSGRTPDGEPYVRIIEERHEGNVLYHSETTSNPKTGATESIRWKLDLATPGAKPEILTDEK
ncbi:uncharacterized protein LOC105433167 [Pogonomyrmex barbatus]|uniref:Uncharacterized protein LOC105433167 n=1 Tax=Pogonomyrmex barbatus TaxID=144034 RepID=A0A6I9XL58_9HYME|nr:uncharacterized protein LOC105433167 [Pogonomyrmex barbatus]